MRNSTVLPDAHIAVSERTQREVGELGVSETQLVPNGISMTEIEAAPCADDPVDILFVGRLIKEKNVDSLVHAIAQLQHNIPDLRCVIVGDGPEHSTIEQLVHTYDLITNIDVAGYCDSHEKVLGLMKAADVFVLPSQREGFGITALEALACGTPVVTIDYPQNAAQALVQDEFTGKVCAATSTALAKAIQDAQQTGAARDCVTLARTYE